MGTPTQYIPTPGRPSSTQLNTRQMIGEILMYVPDAPPQMALRWIQNAYRRILDHRFWYALYVKGQLASPAVYSSGLATTTNGSTSVTGTSTSWTSSMVGRQFRVGFNYPIYTIVDVVDTTHLTLDIPWGAAGLSTVGYMIYQSLYSLGPNVKFLQAMVNQLMGFRMLLHKDNPDILNTPDTWRSQVAWPYLVSDSPYQSPPVTQTYQEKMVELYPAPMIQQPFPYLLYVQPPDLVKDTDCPVAWIRSDVVVLGALSDALMFKGRNSRYYDPTLAAAKLKQQQVEMAYMENNDNAISQRDIFWDFAKYPEFQMGAAWWTSHAELPVYGGDEDY